jgi:hypothetical protein
MGAGGGEEQAILLVRTTTHAPLAGKVQREVHNNPCCDGTRPELRLTTAAAQTRTLSVAGIRPDSRESMRHFKQIFCDDISEIAVGTLITERPPHRSVRAQFGHTACMGLSLSR